MKISATIITFNEERNITDCLASLDFVEEIIVVDSGSTDRTEEICRSYPKVHFYHQEWLGYGKQKNRAAEFAGNNWVLNLDADERVSEQLRASIEQADYSSFSAARMARENYFGKQWIRHCGWYPDHTIRLYDRRICHFSERLVHESLEHDGRLLTLEGNLRHYTYADIADYLRRMDNYSTLAAQEICRSRVNIGVLSLLFRPFFTFVKMFILKRGFLDGYMGWLISMLYAQYTFCKYAKAREMGKNGNHD